MVRACEHDGGGGRIAFVRAFVRACVRACMRVTSPIVLKSDPGFLVLAS